ncbi:hypothetical protein CDAR_288771 [Caerostris darwini]|uniref:Uncharacterized protein n=1 Tax=Caerostris darwini TaxID=1538125 RepID=A0AAV4UF48_9ARAC|nr:hypothetical protein CDAR_288771 [Caerostris darwini]
MGTARTVRTTTSSPVRQADGHYGLKKKDRHPVYQCLRGGTCSPSPPSRASCWDRAGLGAEGAKVWTKREVMYVNFFGELFLNMLKCLILPLIVQQPHLRPGNARWKLTE